MPPRLLPRFDVWSLRWHLVLENYPDTAEAKCGTLIKRKPFPGLGEKCSSCFP